MQVPECFTLANLGTWISCRLSVLFSSGGSAWPILPPPLQVLSLLVTERFRARIPSFCTRRRGWRIHLMHKPIQGLSARRQRMRVGRGGKVARPPSSQGHQPRTCTASPLVAARVYQSRQTTVEPFTPGICHATSQLSLSGLCAHMHAHPPPDGEQDSSPQLRAAKSRATAAARMALKHGAWTAAVSPQKKACPPPSRGAQVPPQREEDICMSVE